MSNKTKVRYKGIVYNAECSGNDWIIGDFLIAKSEAKELTALEKSKHAIIKTKRMIARNNKILKE